MKEIKLGQKVRDRVTGFTGIAIGRSIFLTGCARIGINPGLDKKTGKSRDAEWFDEPMLEVLGKTLIQPKVVTNKDPRDGGPIPSIPTRSADPK